MISHETQYTVNMSDTSDTFASYPEQRLTYDEVHLQYIECKKCTPRKIPMSDH